MSSVFGIGTLLLLLGGALSSPIFSSEDHILFQLNHYRSMFAKDNGISNMNKLSYSKSLENEARNYTASCDLLDKAERLQHYFPVPVTFFENFLWYAQKHKDDIDGVDSLFGFEHYFYSVLRSLHSEVGCARMDVNCKVDAMPNVAKISKTQKFTYDTVCLFGPKFYHSSLERTYGAAGSNCSSGKNGKDPLCKI